MNGRLVSGGLLLVAVLAAASATAAADTKPPVLVKRCGDWQAQPDCVARFSATVRGSQEAKTERTVVFRGDYCDFIRSIDVVVSGSGRQLARAKGTPRVALETKVSMVKPGKGLLDRLAGVVRSGDSLTSRVIRDVRTPGCVVVLDVRAFARQVPLAGASPRFESTTVSVELHSGFWLDRPQ